MSTIFQKYGAGIFGFLIVILTAVSALKVFDLVTVLQLSALALSTILQLGLVKLLPGKWPGAAKTLVDLAGAVVALILPYAIAHEITWQEVILVIIGFIKALATEFAVQIRTDTLINATGSAATKDDPAVITTLPAPAGIVADPDSIVVRGGSQ